jgi:hypothetical protein
MPQLKRMLKNDINVLKIDEWIISYEILDCKFSSKLYEVNKVKEDTKDLS